MLLYKIIFIIFFLPLFFKLTLAPFSVWVVRIYAALPLLFLLFLMTFYKIIYFFIFFKIFNFFFSLIPGYNIFSLICLVLGISSIFIGCLAYRKQDLKSVLAYTTISQMGYILIGLSQMSLIIEKFSFFYLFMYAFHLIIIITIFYLLRVKYFFTNLNELFLVKSFNIYYYYILFFCFLSLAGVPPLVGFFMKYYLLVALYQTGYSFIVFFLIIASFIMSIIYLQILLQIMTEKNINFFVFYQNHFKGLQSLFDFSVTRIFFQYFIKIFVSFLNSFFLFLLFFSIFYSQNIFYFFGLLVSLVNFNFLILNVFFI